jgi:hypothetical protein
MNPRKMDETLETLTATVLFIIAGIMASACGGSKFAQADQNHDGKVSVSECATTYLRYTNTEVGYDYNGYLDCVSESFKN